MEILQKIIESRQKIIEFDINKINDNPIIKDLYNKYSDILKDDGIYFKGGIARYILMIYLDINVNKKDIRDVDFVIFDKYYNGDLDYRTSDYDIENYPFDIKDYFNDRDFKFNEVLFNFDKIITTNDAINSIKDKKIKFPRNTSLNNISSRQIMRAILFSIRYGFEISEYFYNNYKNYMDNNWEFNYYLHLLKAFELNLEHEFVKKTNDLFNVFENNYLDTNKNNPIEIFIELFDFVILDFCNLNKETLNEIKNWIYVNYNNKNKNIVDRFINKLEFLDIPELKETFTKKVKNELLELNNFDKLDDFQYYKNIFSKRNRNKNKIG